jgi:hypothetical protein
MAIMKEAQLKKYIELVYAQDSELRKIENLMDRKIAALMKMAIPDSDEIQAIIYLKDNNARQSILKFIRENNSNKCALLDSREQLFWELQERLMKPLTSSYKNGDNNVDIDDESMLKAVNLKTTISDKAEALLEGIDRLKRQIYIGDDEIEASDIIKFTSPEQRLKTKSA